MKNKDLIEDKILESIRMLTALLPNIEGHPGEVLRDLVNATVPIHDAEGLLFEYWGTAIEGDK